MSLTLFIHLNHHTLRFLELWTYFGASARAPVGAGSVEASRLRGPPPLSWEVAENPHGPAPDPRAFSCFGNGATQAPSVGSSTITIEFTAAGPRPRPSSRCSRQSSVLGHAHARRRPHCPAPHRTAAMAARIQFGWPSVNPHARREGLTHRPRNFHQRKHAEAARCACRTV